MNDDPGAAVLARPPEKLDYSLVGANAARAVEAARDDRAEDRNQRVNGAIAAS